MNATFVLEIGNPWLKMAIFRSAINAYYLKGLTALNMSNQPEETVAKALGAFLKDFQINKPQEIIVSFPRNAVTMRNLRIPATNPEEIDNMIKLHVGRQVPYAKEEIVSGYRVIGKDSMGYSKVMLSIVHRESIRKVFRILEKALLYTDRVELSSDGILSWLCKSAKISDLKTSDAFIILDIDSAYTDFIVSTLENIVFSRVITLGSEQLTDETKWPKFIGEMKQTIVISQGEEVLQKPTKIYIGGAVEKLKNFSSKIEVEFNLPVQVVEPLSNLSLAKEVIKNPADLFGNISMAALLGLGLDKTKKKINFVLPEAQIRKTLRERIRDMILFSAVSMYLILIICGVYLEKMRNQQAAIELLNNRYKEIATVAEDLNQKRERLKKIKSKLDTKSISLIYIYEISKLLPPEIDLMSLSFQKDDRLNIKGRAKEMSDIFKFITLLQNSSNFKDVQTRYTTRRKFQNKDVNEFELICSIAKEAVQKKEKKKKETKNPEL